MDFCWALITGILLAYLLSRWCITVSLPVNLWSNDCKNALTFITYLRTPERFKRDFPLGISGVFDYYMPVFLKTVDFLESKSGSFVGAIAWLYRFMAFFYVMGWTIFVFFWTGDFWVSAVAIFILVPHVTVISADGYSAGVPRRWGPRYWNNALFPIFIIFIWLGCVEPYWMLAAAVWSGFMFNVHPRSGVGTFLVLSTAVVILSLNGICSWWYSLLILTINGVLSIPYTGLYLKNTSQGQEIRNKQKIFHLNTLASKRLYIWPYENPGSYFGKLFGKEGQIILGAIYLIASMLLFFLREDIGVQEYFFIQSFMNTLLMMMMVEFPASFGLMISLLALMGILNLPQVSPMTTIGILVGLTGCYLTRSIFKPFLFGCALALTAWLINGAPITYLPDMFDWMMLATTPLLFAQYIFSCVVFQWLLPFVFKKTIILFDDLSRVVKIALTPVYLWAVKFLALCIDSDATGGGLSIMLKAVAVIAPLIWGMHYVFKIYEGPSESKSADSIYDWVKKNTPADALFHVLTDLPPLHFPDNPMSTSFPFTFRANTMRCITGSFKDGSTLFYSSPDIFLKWYERMKEVQRVVGMRSFNACMDQARRFDADYMVVANPVIRDSIPKSVSPLKVNDEYSIFKVDAYS